MPPASISISSSTFVIAAALLVCTCSVAHAEKFFCSAAKIDKSMIGSAVFDSRLSALDLGIAWNNWVIQNYPAFSGATGCASDSEIMSERHKTASDWRSYAIAQWNMTEVDWQPPPSPAKSSKSGQSAPVEAAPPIYMQNQNRSGASKASRAINSGSIIGSTWKCHIQVKTYNDREWVTDQILHLEESGHFHFNDSNYANGDIVIGDDERWKLEGSTIEMPWFISAPEVFFRGTVSGRAIEGNLISKNDGSVQGSFTCLSAGSRSTAPKAGQRYEWCWAAPLDSSVRKIFYSSIFAIDSAADQQAIKRGFGGYVRRQFPTDGTGGGECGSYATQSSAQKSFDLSHTNSSGYNQLGVIDTDWSP